MVPPILSLAEYAELVEKGQCHWYFTVVYNEELSSFTSMPEKKHISYQKTGRWAMTESEKYIVLGLPKYGRIPEDNTNVGKLWGE